MTTSDPTKTCEDFLRQGIKYNNDHGILPSENEVADRLLRRRLELEPAYAELLTRVRGDARAAGGFLALILYTAAFRNSEASAQSRKDRAQLTKVNAEIAETARALQGLLLRRSELHNTSDFSSDTHISVCDVIEAAGERVSLFGPWIKAPLRALSNRFDLKYWPSIASFVGELASNAETAEPSALDAGVAASVKGQRASDRDFFAYLFSEIAEDSPRFGGMLPEGFTLSDKAMAAFATCALGRGEDDPFTPEYVKNLRGRLSQRGKREDLS